jgi:hypothetical protein
VVKRKHGSRTLSMSLCAIQACASAFSFCNHSARFLSTLAKYASRLPRRTSWRALHGEVTALGSQRTGHHCINAPQTLLSCYACLFVLKNVLRRHAQPCFFTLHHFLFDLVAFKPAMWGQHRANLSSATRASWHTTQTVRLPLREDGASCPPTQTPNAFATTGEPKPMHPTVSRSDATMKPQQPYYFVVLQPVLEEFLGRLWYGRPRIGAASNYLELPLLERFSDTHGFGGQAAWNILFVLRTGKRSRTVNQNVNQTDGDASVKHFRSRIPTQLQHTKCTFFARAGGKYESAATAADANRAKSVVNPQTARKLAVWRCISVGTWYGTPYGTW